MNVKTGADLLFETYLRERGRDDFLYEVPLPETRKVPDYQLRATPRPWLFEVKGFEAAAPTGFGSCDPYAPLRKKINRAANKFKDLHEYSCSLVLHHAGAGLIFLEPIAIFGAMLGDVAFEIPLDVGSCMLRNDRVRSVFTKRGRMIQYGKRWRPEKPVNTTINAVIVIEHYRLGQRRFSRYVDRREASLGRKLSEEEYFHEMDDANGTNRNLSLRIVRARVHENPYARIPLSRNIFNGQHDERYGADEQGRITRIFAGSVVEQFEARPT